MNGVSLIAAERDRQQVEEGYTVEHDAGQAESLLLAAGCYALHPFMFAVVAIDGSAPSVPRGWPWSPEAWKPTPDDRIRELVKAGALIAAAIDDLLEAKP
jgi:hypothetical protein